MPISDKCPFCAASSVIPGKIVYNEERSRFRPDSTRKGFFLSIRWPFGFDFGPRAHFCAKCYMVWTKADPEDADKFLRKFASASLKQALGG